MSHTKPGRKYLAQLCKRYAKASKKQRQLIFDEFVATTGSQRTYASALLARKRRGRDPQQPLRRAAQNLYRGRSTRSPAFGRTVR